ncbi:FtsX-like permease family protein [Candidatus Falkowbacteria bacterium]|nr:FtsX-like permease family protein [Candidatus Falkowbacteria bacterium]
MLSLLRILKFSLQDITRNIWLSAVTVIILILALFSINMLVIVKLISDTAVDAIKEKIDISLYLNPDSEDNEINALKATISNFEQVKEVEYVSKSEALEIFRQRNEDNPEILQALRELGKNPLTPTLVIKPKNLDHLDQLIHQINKLDSEVIDSRNFSDHKTILERINSVTDKVSQAGLVLSMIFLLITLSVVFNAVRVAIYTHSTEIAIMRLVGASYYFIYMPFMISSLVYTFIGIVAIIAVFYPFLSLLQPYLEAFFVGYNINIINYFNSNFIIIFGLEFLGIALINVIASFLAVRRYSNV